MRFEKCYIIVFGWILCCIDWYLIQFNMLRPRQNGHHVADDLFKCIFLNENVSMLLKISLKFVPKGPINNIPALVQIMAWHRPGDKSLSEPIMVKSSALVCATLLQWVKGWKVIWFKFLLPNDYTFNTVVPVYEFQTFSDELFIMKGFLFWFEFCWILFPVDTIDNMSVLAQLMAWHWTGDKPLPKPMMTKFTDAY